MNEITLETIKLETNKIEIQFSVSDGIQKYFAEDIFCAEYFLDNQMYNLNDVPESILVIPLLCNLLPVAWLTDSTIIVQALDKSFYDSIEEFKQGYINMYPDCVFKGNVIVDSICDNTEVIDIDKSAAFFSAGVDAYCTLAKHIKEKPDLLTIWGSDIPYDNQDGWRVLHDVIQIEAEKINLPLIVIKSNFRKILNEIVLSEDFGEGLHDGWWHGAQHGIGLIGHAAPICYARKIKNLYIAASYCKEAYHTCASDPTIDNYVKFGITQTTHDCFISRQDKIKIIVDEHKKGLPVELHVCWKNTTGVNCCTCEKCCRTIMGIFAEGEHPENYGFPSDEKIYLNCAKLCKKILEYDDIVRPLWKQIQNRAKQNIDLITERDLYKYTYPLFEIDFDTINSSATRKLRSIKRRVINRFKRVFDL